MMIGAGVIYLNNGNVLLLKRSSNSSNPETWDFPGGHSKNKETPIETAQREVREEIGATFNKPFNKVNKDGFTIFLVKDKPKIKLNREHIDFKWIKIEEIDNYNLHPKVRKNWAIYKKELKRNQPMSFKEWFK